MQLQCHISPNLLSISYLHHGDSLGTILVSQPLTGDNYNSWSRSMIMVLTVKNKLGLVNGSFTKP